MIYRSAARACSLAELKQVMKKCLATDYTYVSKSYNPDQPTAGIEMQYCVRAANTAGERLPGNIAIVVQQMAF
jgi:hypothetical protein